MKVDGLDELLDERINSLKVHMEIIDKYHKYW